MKLTLWTHIFTFDVLSRCPVVVFIVGCLLQLFRSGFRESHLISWFCSSTKSCVLGIVGKTMVSIRYALSVLHFTAAYTGNQLVH